MRAKSLPLPPVPGATGLREEALDVGRQLALSFTFLEGLTLRKSPPSSARGREHTHLPSHALSALLGLRAKFPWSQGGAYNVTEFPPGQVRTGPVPVCRMVETMATPQRTCWVTYLEPNSSRASTHRASTF